MIGKSDIAHGTMHNVTKMDFTTGCDDDEATGSCSKGAVVDEGCEDVLVFLPLGIGVPGGVGWRLKLPPAAMRVLVRCQASS